MLQRLLETEYCLKFNDRGVSLLKLLSVTSLLIIYSTPSIKVNDNRFILPCDTDSQVSISWWQTAEVDNPCQWHISGN